jgi:hypothetical protein
MARVERRPSWGRYSRGISLGKGFLPPRLKGLENADEPPYACFTLSLETKSHV